MPEAAVEAEVPKKAVTHALPPIAAAVLPRQCRSAAVVPPRSAHPAPCLLALPAVGCTPNIRPYNDRP